ncbi:metal-dependent hydrolase family protein [Steroidobacter sp.]|uniref:metal-dependent hydrolase family protein n=1 Tax=Steroidobacter sp. TaxID=1978227 RepID=UPI001A53808B|nr:amidohydrolase family protein [Steroidobacter sp.]MBL8266958.1 amidohydrolase family protein [Steroidobacter sp.]
MIQRIRRASRSAAVIGAVASVLFGVGGVHAAEQASSVVVHCGTLIDPAVSAQPLTERSIVIEQGRVVRVDSGFVAAPAGAQTVDLRQATCLPGFIDSHTHLTMDFSKGSYLSKFVDTDGDMAYKAARNAKTVLLAGFTTVRDLGSQHLIDVALKNAIERGDVAGPRMLVATNSLSITGGHADPSAGYREELFHPTEADGVVDGVDSAIRGTRIAVKRGADVIKVTATGGVMSVADHGSGPQFTSPELLAIVETARDHGLKVAAHAHGDAGAYLAVAAGVASIEHGTYLTQKTYALMKKNHVYLTPTVIAGVSVAEAAKTPGFFPPSVAAKALEIGPLMVAALGRAWKAGVPIAFGTDSGVYPHGRNAREFGYMVEAGVPAVEAIRSATQNAADLLDRSKDIGSLQPGRFADIVAVQGNPLADVRLLEQVWFVMKQGRIYKADGNAVAF